MTYRLVQLAPGSYDIEFEGKVVASLVRDIGSGGRARRTWTAELLDEGGRMPSPFKRTVHVFGSLGEAMFWLGDPEVVHTVGGEFARRTILSRG